MATLTSRFVLAGAAKNLTVGDICEKYNFTTRDQFDEAFAKVFPDGNAQRNILRKLEQNQKERDRIEKGLMKRSRKARKTEKVIILTETKSEKATEVAKATKSVNSDKKQAEPIDLYAVKKQEVDSIEKRLSRLEKRDEDLTEKINSTTQDIAKLDEEIGKYAVILSNLRRKKMNKNISLRYFREKEGDIKDQITTCTAELKKARQNLAQITTIEVLIYENSDFEVADIAKAPISDPRKSENFTARVINACAELSEKPNCKNLLPIDVMSVSVAKIIKEDNPDRNIKFIFENGDKLLDILKALEK